MECQVINDMPLHGQVNSHCIDVLMSRFALEIERNFVFYDDNVMLLMLDDVICRKLLKLTLCSAGII